MKILVNGRLHPPRQSLLGEEEEVDGKSRTMAGVENAQAVSIAPVTWQQQPSVRFLPQRFRRR